MDEIFVEAVCSQEKQYVKSVSMRYSGSIARGICNVPRVRTTPDGDMNVQVFPRLGIGPESVWPVRWDVDFLTGLQFPLFSIDQIAQCALFHIESFCLE